MWIGLNSPVYSVRFLLSNKAMMFLGIIPHFVNVIFYFWFLRRIVIGQWLLPIFQALAHSWEGSFLAYLFHPTFIEIFVWMMGILFYGVLGTSFVNAVASPLYDIIAKKAYEKTLNQKLPKQGFWEFVNSIFSELTKALILFCLFIVSFFVHIFAPVAFIIAIWYFGWNSIDRTLLLMNLPLRKRLLFGVRHWGYCFGLGFWSYIPFVGVFIAFTLAASGALVVAHHEKKVGPL